LATLRDTRYQAVVLCDRAMLLLRCAFRNGPTVWILPGGGREDTEDEESCVAREVREETGLAVRVDRLLLDEPAQPPDGTYRRWRTYLCTVVSGQAAAGGGEGADAELIDIVWLPLDAVLDWPVVIRDDPFLAPQLHSIRAMLENDGAASHPPAV
jgi:8-oxo-dGTP pyrophosphatase MutT (NUDIX family)